MSVHAGKCVTEDKSKTDYKKTQPRKNNQHKIAYSNVTWLRSYTRDVTIFEVVAFGNYRTRICLLKSVVWGNLILGYIWMFVYFLCFQTPPKRRVVRLRNLARKGVTTTSRTSVGFCVYMGRRYQKKWHFKAKIPECKQTLRSADG